MNACITAVQQMLAGAGDYDTHLASHLSWMTRNLSSVLAEVRKWEQAERKRADAMTLADEVALVSEWLAEVTVEQRRALRTRLDELDAEGGLLAM